MTNDKKELIRLREKKRKKEAKKAEKKRIKRIEKKKKALVANSKLITDVEDSLYGHSKPSGELETASGDVEHSIDDWTSPVVTRENINESRLLAGLELSTEDSVLSSMVAKSDSIISIPDEYSGDVEPLATCTKEALDNWESEKPLSIEDALRLELSPDINKWGESKTGLIRALESLLEIHVLEVSVNKAGIRHRKLSRPRIIGDHSVVIKIKTNDEIEVSEEDGNFVALGKIAVDENGKSFCVLSVIDPIDDVKNYIISVANAQG